MFIFCVNRMYHIDDVPSGAGEGIIDFRKAMAVSNVMLSQSEACVSVV